MKVLYIAGPYDDEDPLHGIQNNILEASRVALEAWGQGWAVLCPHKNSGGFHHDHTVPRDQWLEGYLELLSRCDAILMMPLWGYSEGAQAERGYAIERGIPIINYGLVYGVPKPREVFR